MSTPKTGLRSAAIAAARWRTHGRSASRRGPSPSNAALNPALCAATGRTFSGTLRWAYALAAVALANCTLPEEYAPELVWEVEEAPRVSALVARDATGEVLRLACRDVDDRLIVRAKLIPQAGASVLTLRTLEAVHPLDVRRAADSGILAEGEIPPPLLTYFLSGGGFSLFYGGQELGPVVVPSEDAVRFSGACFGAI